MCAGRVVSRDAGSALGACRRRAAGRRMEAGLELGQSDKESLDRCSTAIVTVHNDKKTQVVGTRWRSRSISSPGGSPRSRAGTSRAC